MEKILQLREKRAKLWEETKQFLDEHTDKDGKLSAEDAETYDRMEKDVVALGKDIERLERQAAIEAEMQQTKQPITNTPNQKKPESKKGRASDEYRQAMIKAIRTNFRQVDDILQEGIDSAGGYLVPEEYDSRLIDVLEEENIMRKLATRITTSGEHKINMAANKPAASWIEEGGAIQFSDATFDQIMIDAHKLHVAIKITNELLYDNAFNLEAYIIKQFGRAIANAEEDAFLNGDGKGKPTGLFKMATVGIQTTAADIKADDIISLIYSLKRPYRRNASFIMNDSTIAALRKLKDGNGQYLWQPSYQAGEADHILGYTIHTSPFVPEIAAGNLAIAFGDYSYYNIADRGGRTLQELKELFAGNGLIGYLMTERVDGTLVQPEAVRVLKMKGTSTSGS